MLGVHRWEVGQHCWLGAWRELRYLAALEGPHAFHLVPKTQTMSFRFHFRDPYSILTRELQLI